MQGLIQPRPTRTIIILMSEPAQILLLAFTVDSTTFCAGNSVTFTGIVSGGTASSWSWNFGTGATPQTASTQIASVVFSSGGAKTITLTTNVGNKTQTITFTQNPLPPQPGSISGSASICAGTNAVFIRGQ